MSYDTMDHAGWVEQNAAAAKSLASSSGRNRRGDNSRGWNAAPEKLSLFQAQVFDILGIAGGGIYNAPIAWDAVEWSYGFRGLAVPWRDGNDLSTFDYSPLTMMVLLCHEARIRLAVRTHGPRHFLLVFHPREATGGIGVRHPSIDEAVANLRARIPADHRILQPRPREMDETGRLIKQEAA